MPARVPGELTASRVAVLPGGDVAEVVLAERTGAYGTRFREAYARWFSDGAWSAWHFVTEGAEDVSIAADTGKEAALISVVVWAVAPAGAIAANHVAHRAEYYRMTADGVHSTDL